jgi:non-heme chloroperoxidase
MPQDTISPILPIREREPGFIRTADDVGLFYRDRGQGQPLLFLSGWTLNSEMWAY